MRFDLLYLLIPLSSAQFLPFNILNIPPQVRNPMIQTYMEMTKVNTQCFRDIKQFIGDVINASFAAQKCKSLDCLKDEKITNASYALKQIAATGRPQSLGLEDVSLTWPGDPKLCRSIEGPYETKYCYAHVNVDFGSIDFAEYGIQIPGGKIPNFDMGETSGKCDPLAIGNMRLAMCIPASCEKDQDMGRIISTVTNDSVHLCEMTCTGPTKEPDTFFYLMNAVILSLLVVAVTASILDYIATQNDMELELKNTTGIDKSPLSLMISVSGWKILMSFSLLRNTTEIFSVTKGQDSIRSLDALRFITFTWVANGHADLMSADGDNSLAMLKAPDYILSDVFLNAYPAVDTFFVISGLLLAYWFFRKAHGDSKFIKSPMNWVMYYVHRWLRLTPAYLLFIGFYVAWSPQIHDVWAAGSSQNLTLQVQNCEKNWWMNALYMNNFASIVEMLYFVAPIFLVAIYYSWKTGLVAVVSGVLFSVGATILLTAVYDLPAIGFTVLQTGSNDFMSYLYIKPWVRCIPFLTGILTGYFIVQIRKQTIKIRQPKTWELALCWLTSTIVALTIIFSIYNYMRGQSEWNVPLRSFYGSFARIGWSMAIAWVVLACTFDLAGPVKTVLEHPLWYPLGRLSYCAFLSHWFMLQYFMDSADRPTHFVSLLHTYLSITLPVCFLSYLMAYVWSCLVEIPFMKIEVIIVDLAMKRRGNRSNNITDVVRKRLNKQNDVGVTTIAVDNLH